MSDEGVIVVDPLNVRAAKILKAEIAKITDKPVRYVAYSNSFFERSSGGQIFKDDGAQFVAQISLWEFDFPHKECESTVEQVNGWDIVDEPEKQATAC